MNLAVIPARGGSKRIPRKNIRRFQGKPMIGWSIKAAMACNCFDRIIVSTDDEEIGEVARGFGAEVPFVRPAALSNDTAGTIPVVAHAIESLKEQGWEATAVCCLYATAPFVRPQDLRLGLQRLQDSNADYAFSVASYPFPVQRAIRITAGGRVEMLHPEHFQTRSQDLEEVYHDAGQFYWGTAKAWQDELPIFSAGAVPIVLPRYRVQDIDTIEDWERAELMFAALQERSER